METKENIKEVKEKGGILLFEQWHGKRNIGSSRIRGHWLAKYWDGLEIFQQGVKYSFVIFQKCFWLDYVKAYKGIKILDLCVSGDSLVFTDNGWKYVSEVKIGDKLLTHKGRFQEVSKIFKRKDNVRKLKATGLCELKVTGNHPVWAIRNKYDGYGKVKLGKFDFVPVDKLKIFERHKGGNCIVSFKEREFNVNGMSEDLGWFYGYYCAEGSGNKNGVSFAMHKNEVEQRKRILSIIKKEFKKEGRYYENGNAGNVVFNSRRLRQFLVRECKNRSEKVPPSDIFNVSVKSKLAFLEAYIAGDGYCNDYGGISVASISKKLAYSVLRLFKDCGILAMISYQKREGENYCFRHKDGKVYQGKPQWRVQLNPKEAIKFYNLTDIKRYKKCRIGYWRSLKSVNTEIIKKDKYCLYPVRKVEDGKIETVYNFDVENDHSYIVDDIIVKNCDPDWLDTVPVVEVMDNCDAVTTSSEALRDEVKKFTDKPVVFIPDRQDLEFHNVQKKHEGKAKWVVWFGYSHNAKTLDKTLLTMKRANLKLKVISNCRPPYLKVDKNVKFDWDNPDFDFNRELLEADFVLMPPDERPRGRFKSKNKTYTSWALGMPVATTPEELKRFLDPEERKKEAEIRLKEVREKYDVKLSVIDFKELIKILQDAKK